MPKDANRRPRLSPQQLDQVESQLESAFSPVRPNPEFVNRLKQNLSNPPDMGLEMRSQLVEAIQALGIAMVGILTISLVLRIVWMLFKWIGLIHPEDARAGEASG